jgi:L-histidine Nalpha-methyltransferase
MPPPTTCDPDLLQAVHEGLGRSPKTLPCLYFYDREGSLLFEQICDLPEYYLTRTEDRILRERADEIVGSLPPDVDLVELGSGSSRKTRRLIAALFRRQRTLRYIPVDISGEMLNGTAAALSADYPGLSVHPLVAEYRDALARLRREAGAPKLVLFLGSNLGNFDPDEAVRFLRGIREMMAARDRALLGLDLQKDPAVLEAAYDDAAGVTARFNLNLLARLNREADAGFVLDRFAHRAAYNRDEGRVEMHLVSRCDQAITVGGRKYGFAAGETIHTENSYKYTPAQIRELSVAAHLAVERSWYDDARLFSLNLLRPARAPE